MPFGEKLSGVDALHPLPKASTNHTLIGSGAKTADSFWLRTTRAREQEVVAAVTAARAGKTVGEDAPSRPSWPAAPASAAVSGPVLERAFEGWRNIDKGLGDRIAKGVQGPASARPASSGHVAQRRRPHSAGNRETVGCVVRCCTVLIGNGRWRCHAANAVIVQGPVDARLEAMALQLRHAPGRRGRLDSLTWCSHESSEPAPAVRARIGPECSGNERAATRKRRP